MRKILRTVSAPSRKMTRVTKMRANPVVFEFIDNLLLHYTADYVVLMAAKKIENVERG